MLVSFSADFSHPDLVAGEHHEPLAHVSRRLVVSSQAGVLRTLGKDDLGREGHMIYKELNQELDLQVLRLSVDEVHEVVQAGGGWLGGVGEVGLLHRDKEGGGQQTVSKHKLACRDVNLEQEVE